MDTSIYVVTYRKFPAHIPLNVNKCHVTRQKTTYKGSSVTLCRNKLTVRIVKSFYVFPVIVQVIVFVKGF